MTAWRRELRPTLALALPIVAGQLSQMLMGITDSVMLGHVGTVDLAAASFTGAVFGLVYIACIGLLQPGSVLVAQAHGARDEVLAGCWLRHARAVAWAAGLGLGALMAASLLAADRFGQPAEVVSVMGPYYLLIAASLAPTLVFQADRQFAEAMGRPWEPLVIMLAGVVLNVGLNWVLIFGRLGVPELGLTGAGVATLISRFATVLGLRWWLNRHRGFDAALGSARGGRLEGGRMKSMLALGVPMGAALLFEGGAFSAAAVMSGWLGTVPLAAHQIAVTCAATSFMVPLGVALALSVRVGQAVGAGERERVRALALGAALVVCGTAGLAALFFVLAGGAVARGFTPDAAVTTLAARVLLIVAMFQFFDGLQVVFSGALRGLTDVHAPMAAAFVAYWVLALPAGWWWGVRGGGGLEAIWWALAAGLAAATVLLGWRLKRLAG